MLAVRRQAPLQALRLGQPTLHGSFRVRGGSAWVAPFRHYQWIVTGV
jgi:hypothetical protein